MAIENVFVCILLIVAVILFYFGFKIFLYFQKKQKALYTKKVLNKPTTSRCPICNSLLMQQDKLISRVYGNIKKKDQRCTIHGCPYCYPIEKNGVKRICPVCGKKIPEDGYLISRLFIRDEAKRHVHIIGCTECSKH